MVARSHEGRPAWRRLREIACQYDCPVCGAWKAFVIAVPCVEREEGQRWAPDYMVAYLCGQPGGCRDKYEGRVGSWTLEEKRAFWNEAYRRTVAIWFNDYWISVK
jgi:hypothetical protein